MSSRPATSTVPDRDDAHGVGDLAGVERAHVCVLAGGRSSEREVSLASGARIAAALRAPAGAGQARGPRRVSLVEVADDGRWQVGRESLAPGLALERLTDVDLFFLGLHGGEGEDGTLQGLLAASDRPFTGSGVSGSALAMDKVLSRDLVAGVGARVARGVAVSRARWDEEREAVLGPLAAWPVGGWVVKPRRGGSSVGTTLVRSAAALGDALQTAFEWEDQVLVEEAVEGVEVTGGVVVEPCGRLVALPIVEIRPAPGRFFDYDEKYAEDGALELCPPESVDAGVQRRIAALSLLAHERLGCEGYSRSDFLVPRSALGGWDEPVFLETNTLPGMTPRSLLPRAAEARGVDYRTLCLWIAADGLRRGRR